jgi:hypothetical protein
MLQSLFRRNSLRRVQRDHLHQQVQPKLIKVLEIILRVDPLELRERTLVVWEVGNSGPSVVVGRTVEGEDLEDLIDFGVAHEESLPLDQLDEDAPYRPNVNGKRVLLLSEENFWGPVPESFDFVGEGPDRDAESSGKTEICELYHSVFIDEKVLGLQVSVDNATGVAVVQAAEDLIEVGLGIRGRESFLP